jgi:hypothetical protein
MKIICMKVPLWSQYDPSTGVCFGTAQRVPTGLAVEILAEDRRGRGTRPLVRVRYRGRYWYGWTWTT